MNIINLVLNFLLKLTNTISHATGSIPSWLFKIVIRFIPAAKGLLTAIEGKKTSILAFLAICLTFMEKYDWVDIGSKICGTADFFLGIINKYANANLVCDPSWFPHLATILTAILLNATRIISKGTIHKDIKPIGV